jgi:phosphoglucosamine mutase
MTNPVRQLFGTDGIRGIAGEFPLTSESTFLIGRALGHDLNNNAKPLRVIIGQDTRESSPWIADRVMAGLKSAGVEPHSAGVITTPGVAYLARSRGYGAGVVISASHNPWTDNGIKVFSGDGYKLPDAREAKIEEEIFSQLKSSGSPDPADAVASLPGEADLRREYIDWLASNVETDLRALRVLVDCAHGAAAAEAPELFKVCGVKAEILHASPDGKNINEGCGALHPETLAHTIAQRPGAFDLGITFDGDADRALFSDAQGRVVNGDAVLLLAAREMQARNALPGSTVVATTMSNMGLQIALRNSGIRMLRANVGDKYVLEEMMKSGAALGGEQSGHIIFRDGDATTGDGLLTALRVMEVIARSGKALHHLVADLKVLPQTIQNVRVKEKVPFAQVPKVQSAIASAERELDGNGRVVVRYSGTEALARVMVEAEDPEKMLSLTRQIAQAIRESIGS